MLHSYQRQKANRPFFPLIRAMSKHNKQTAIKWPYRLSYQEARCWRSPGLDKPDELNKRQSTSITRAKVAGPLAADVLFVLDPLRGMNDVLLANTALFFCSPITSYYLPHVTPASAIAIYRFRGRKLSTNQKRARKYRLVRSALPLWKDQLSFVQAHAITRHRTLNRPQ